MTITLSWPLIAAIIATVMAISWCGRQDYRGAYNFTAIYTVPATAAMICFAWLIYFAARVAFGF